MQLIVNKRRAGHIPLGALVMLPLFAMPIGGWLVETGWVHFGRCALKQTLGIPCFTCGATRATLRLLHGDIGAAFGFQPMIMLVYAAVAIWGVISLAGFAANRRVRVDLSRRQSLCFKVLLVVVPLANWAYLIAVGI